MIQVVPCFQKAVTCDGVNVVTHLPCVRGSACMLTAKQQMVLGRETVDQKQNDSFASVRTSFAHAFVGCAQAGKVG